MAQLRCDFFSDVLRKGTSMTVLLPQSTTSQIGLAGTVPEGPPPVLYLLHGLSDDCTTWVRRTSIERYVADRGLAVVMPQVERSFYVDTAAGERYGEFLTRELPEVVQQFFRVSGRPEDTFVAGLSMGGYGALRWALTEPERFAAAASLSGALDVATLQDAEDDSGACRQVFGRESVRDTEHDLYTLLDSAQDMPPMYVCCGTADPLLPMSETFRDRARAAGARVTYDAGPGAHDWAYWDARIQDVLDWLPLPASDDR